MEDRILGKFTCAGCGYIAETEKEIFNHIMKFHPNLKDDIRNRYRSVFSV